MFLHSLSIQILKRTFFPNLFPNNFEDLSSACQKDRQASKRLCNAFTVRLSYDTAKNMEAAKMIRLIIMPVFYSTEFLELRRN